MMPDTLQFIRPWFLLLAPLGMACTWYLLRYIRGQSNWDGICDPHLARLLLVSPGGRHSRLPLVGACLMLAIALKPAWFNVLTVLFAAYAGLILYLTA